MAGLEDLVLVTLFVYGTAPATVGLLFNKLIAGLLDNVNKIIYNFDYYC